MTRKNFHEAAMTHIMSTKLTKSVEVTMSSWRKR